MIKKEKISLNKVTKVLLGVFLLIFAVITVLFTVEQAASGSEIALLEKEKTILSNESQELTNQLVQISSLSEVQKKAEEMKFAKPTKVFYINEKETVAKLP